MRTAGQTKNGFAMAVFLILNLLNFSPLFSLSQSRRLQEINEPPEFTISLTDWFIQSSEKLKTGGAELSSPGLMVDRWYPARVPSTVLGTLVENNVYKNIFFGKNLENIKPDDFKVSWWYRTEFLLTALPGQTTAKLELDGVNYRANIWLNGQKIAASSEIYGAFRRFELDLTQAVKWGEKNALAIEVIPPVRGEPTIGFVDWNPAPPDNNMGLWREVRIRLSGDVSLKNPFVQTKLDTVTLKEARLTISAEVQNNSSRPITGTLEAELENIKISEQVKLEPKEIKKVIFSPESYPQLVIRNPRVWWTHDLGSPELYLLLLSFKTKPSSPRAPAEKLGEKNRAQEKEADRDSQEIKNLLQFRSLEGVSDRRSVRFGIREVKDYFNEQGHRGYLLNGKKILIRGGGWTDEIFLNKDSKKLRSEILYARHMNLNALRLEGFWGSSEELYDLGDENGILLLVGWSCQWEWENHLGKPTDPVYGGIISPEDMALIAHSFRDQVRWLRNHPSIFVWALASDLVPKPELEKEYQKILQEDDPTRPFLVSTGTKTSSVSGKSGVKMNGPYDWVPPNYWFEDKKRGGAFGFNTETGPGPQVSVLESLKRMIPEKSLWPPDDVWNFHCARGKFNNLDRYNEAMSKRLGQPQSVEEYCLKAQYLNYEGMRAMFEAFVANRYLATGIIQWMYNSAWPKLWWQLYDYYLLPTGAFYGAKKACEPVHLIYNYETKEIIASNLSASRTEKLRALIRVFNFDLKEKFRTELPLELEPDGKTILLQLPELTDLSKTYFLDLRILSSKGELKSQNFYCLSTSPDILDEARSTWYVTPVKQHADLTLLNSLPEASIKVRSRIEDGGVTRNITLELENDSPNLAFMVEISVRKKLRQKAVAPIFLEDNYFSLMPGEKRTLRGYFYFEDLEGDEPEIRLQGWNIRTK